VEETNAAIEQTEAQAGELDKVVDVFAIEDKAAAIPAATPARTAGPTIPRRPGKPLLVEGNAAVNWTEF
jgi:methyl-accepting chemotaxis protein